MVAARVCVCGGAEEVALGGSFVMWRKMKIAKAACARVWGVAFVCGWDAAAVWAAYVCGLACSWFCRGWGVACVCVM